MSLGHGLKLEDILNESDDEDEQPVAPLASRNAAGSLSATTAISTNPATVSSSSSSAARMKELQAILAAEGSDDSGSDDDRTAHLLTKPLDRSASVSHKPLFPPANATSTIQSSPVRGSSASLAAPTAATTTAPASTTTTTTSALAIPPVSSSTPSSSPFENKRPSLSGSASGGSSLASKAPPTLNQSLAAHMQDSDDDEEAQGGEAVIRDMMHRQKKKGTTPSTSPPTSVTLPTNLVTSSSPPLSASSNASSSVTMPSSSPQSEPFVLSSDDLAHPQHRHATFSSASTNAPVNPPSSSAAAGGAATAATGDLLPPARNLRKVSGGGGNSAVGGVRMESLHHNYIPQTAQSEAEEKAEKQRARQMAREALLHGKSSFNQSGSTHTDDDESESDAEPLSASPSTNAPVPSKTTVPSSVSAISTSTPVGQASPALSSAGAGAPPTPSFTSTPVKGTDQYQNMLQNILNEDDDSSDEDDATVKAPKPVPAANAAAPAQPAVVAARPAQPAPVAGDLNMDSSSDSEDEELNKLAARKAAQANTGVRAANAQANAAAGGDKANAAATAASSAGVQMSDFELSLIPNMLTRAEVLEQNLSTLGNYQLLNPLAQAQKNRTAAATSGSKSAAGAGVGANIVGSNTASLVRLLALDRISAELERLRTTIGLVTCCCLHPKLFAVGTSRGIVLIFDHFESKLMALGKTEDTKLRGSITTIDMNNAGDQLLVGYSKGCICVWDIHNKSIIKVIADASTFPICFIQFTKQEVSNNKSWTFVAADTAGCLNLFILTKQLFSYGLDKQVLLQGKAGPVLASAVLTPNQAFPHFCDHFSLVAIATETVTSIISLEPQVAIVYRMAREVNERVGVVPVLAWRSMQTRDELLNHPQGLAEVPNIQPLELEICRHPILAICRGKTLTLLQIAPLTDKTEINESKPKVPLKFNILHTQTFPKDIKDANWVGNGTILMLIFAPNDEIVAYDPFSFPITPLTSIDGKTIGIVHSEFFVHPVSGAPELSFSPSISSTDSSLLLLGSEKISELRILPWNERLDAFIHNTKDDNPNYIDCLALALEFYHGVAKAPYGLPRDLKGVQNRLKDKMIELISNFVHVMLLAKEGSGSVSSGASAAGGDLDFLTGGARSSTSLKSDKQYLKVLGGTCIAYCISINRYDILFGDIADKFKYHYPFSFTGTGSPVSLGTELFLELLEPYVLNDQLLTVPVHILQDMFSLYHYKKRLAQLEQVLLHLNPLSLDLNFLIPMCKTYRLFSACIYLYNRGHSAFHTPLEEILGTLTTPSNLGVIGSLSSTTVLSQTQSHPLGPLTDGEKSKISYKLLLYIDYCFRGRTFPRKQQELPLEYRAGVKAQVLSVLFRKKVSSVESHLDLPDYPFLSYFINVSLSQFLGILAQVFEGDDEWMDYVTENNNANADQADEKQPLSAPPSSSPPTAINSLMSPIDASKALVGQTAAGMANIAGAASSLLFGASSSASPQSTAPAPKKRVHLLKASGVPTRQEMLDALLFLVLDQLQFSPPAQSTSHAALLLPFTYQSKPEQLGELFQFAARYLARGVVTASSNFVNRIFTHLCSTDSRLPESVNAPLSLTGAAGSGSSGAAAAGSQQSSAANAVQEYVREQGEREVMMLSLLSRVSLTDQEVDALHMRVRGAGFWVVMVYLSLASGKRDFLKTLDAFLKAVENKDTTVLPGSLVAGSQSHNQPLIAVVGKVPVVALFDFIHQAMNDSSLPVNVINNIRTATLQRLPELVKANSDRTARLILEDFSNEHERVVNALNAFPELQFLYLQAIMTGHQHSHSAASSAQHESKEDGGSAPLDIHSSSVTSGRLSGSSGISELSMTELLQRSGLQFTPRVHELYIKLLCTFAPTSVLAHLSSHQDYDIESALKLCQEFHVDDAAAFLLERTGDVLGALELTLQAVDQKIIALRKFLDDNWRKYPLPPAASAAGGVSVAPGNTASNAAPGLRKQSSTDSAVLSAASTTSSLSGNELGAVTLMTSPDYLKLNKFTLNTINTATLLCQRSMDSEKLWFALLDRFVTLLRTLKSQQASDKKAAAANASGNFSKMSNASAAITALPMDAAVSYYLQSSLYSYVRLVLSSMMQHLELSSLLNKITTDHQSDTLREFRETIQSLLDTYSYEESILATANNLLSTDKFHSIVVLHQKKASAFQAKMDACGCCGRSIMDATASSSSSRFLLFDCGHIFHDSCLGKHADSCMICQRESASAAAKKRANSRGVDKKGSAATAATTPSHARGASKDASNAGPNVPATPSSAAETTKSRALNPVSGDQLVHRLIIAEKKFNRGAIKSMQSFNTKLKKFGRGGLDDLDDEQNDDDFRNPFNSGGSSASSSAAMDEENEYFNFHMPAVRSGMSLASQRQPGQMLKPSVVKGIGLQS